MAPRQLDPKYFKPGVNRGNQGTGAHGGFKYVTTLIGTLLGLSGRVICFSKAAHFDIEHVSSPPFLHFCFKEAAGQNLVERTLLSKHKAVLCVHVHLLFNYKSHQIT